MSKDIFLPFHEQLQNKMLEFAKRSYDLSEEQRKEAIRRISSLIESHIEQEVNERFDHWKDTKLTQQKRALKEQYEKQVV